MKVIITGATGMVGEGVLMECMQNHAVHEILMVNRKPSTLKHSKLKELLVPDFTQLERFTAVLTGYDACFYCAGVSSVGMNEEKYTYITYNTTIAFATQLAALNPRMVFTFVTGASTDSTEKGKVMWARVKGRTENALMRLPFKGVYNFRPGFMKPFKGQQNIKTLFKILIPVVSLFIAKSALSLQQVGQAMINAVQQGYPKHVLEIADIKDLSSK